MSDYIAFDSEVYVNRRKKLKETLGKGSVVFLGNDESPINYADNCYTFRQDSTFLYYFGIDRPKLIGWIDVETGDEILFGDNGSIDSIVWTGYVIPLSELAERVGITKVLPRVEAIKFMRNDTLYLPPYRADHQLLLSHLFGMKLRKVLSRPSLLLIKAVCAQREIKSPVELTEINKAVKISQEMHLEVMRMARPGIKESELVAIASKVAGDHNVMFSFQPIVTIKGEVLHNHYYGNTLSEGDMLLFDGGCESPSHYAGDITRTYPVGDEFDSRQRALYDIVFKTLREAEASICPGIEFREVHLNACRSIIEGLKDLGLMKGSTEAALENNVHTLFFQCGLGHMMGLDVHDMENFGEEIIGYDAHQKKSTLFGLKSLRLAKSLKQGHVITIEPGIYIIPHLIDLRRSEGAFSDYVNYPELEKWRHVGGIRIENDLVVTDNGSQILGLDMPTSADEVVSFRNSVI